jgi:antitoxin (DNA-binding transcriptional repressor) of toxin-antitoxin stability system
MKVRQIGTLEAKTRFSKLLAEVERGQRFQITRHGKVVAELCPPSVPKGPRKGGFAKGFVTYMAPDFDAPLDDFRDYMP